jgi:hypothetical protein
MEHLLQELLTLSENRPTDIAYAMSVLLFLNTILKKKNKQGFFTCYAVAYFQITVLVLYLGARFGTALGALILACLAYWAIAEWESDPRLQEQHRLIVLFCTLTPLCLYASHFIVVSADIIDALSQTERVFALKYLPGPSLTYLLVTYVAIRYSKLVVACSYMVSIHTISLIVALIRTYISERDSSKR